jgi:hypothetical protein
MNDVIKAAEAFGYFGCAILTLSKMATFYFFMDKIYELMDKLEEMFSNGLFFIYTYQQHFDSFHNFVS